VPDAERDASQVAQSLGAFSLLDVDTVAVRDPDSAAPSYPSELAQRGVEGFAAMRFVVDSTGLIDLATVTTLDASNELFVRAVRAAMPQMHFRAARMGSVAVRQLAEQEFRFELRPAQTASSDQATGPHKAKPDR
jgi:TonB family protein